MELFFAFLVELYQSFWGWLSSMVIVEGVTLFGIIAVVFILTIFLNHFLLRAR